LNRKKKVFIIYSVFVFSLNKEKEKKKEKLSMKLMKIFDEVN